MDAHHCSRCRRPLAPDAAHTIGRLCPRCVLVVLAAPVSHPPDAPTEIAGPPDATDPTLQEPRFQPAATFGPYRIGRLLGRGGMGEVYEAEHLDQRRRIALKVLNQRLRRADDRTRFLQEGRLAASINHPNSVYIFGSEEIDGIPVIAMELLPGGTLKDRVNAKGPLPVAEAVDAILQVIAGLDAAHAAGVLHRDIKPSNCFIDHDGTVKVGDFGLSISTLSRPVSSLPGVGAFQGTPDFASPEQLRGDSLDVRADIYAVGATLFYLLSGQPPSAGRSPRDLQPTIPWSLDNLVTRCLAKNPDARFRSYAPLSQELQPFRSVVTARPSVGLRLAAGIFNLLLLVPVLGVLLATLISTGLVKTVGAASAIVVITSMLALVLGPRRPKSRFASVHDLFASARRLRSGPAEVRAAAAAPAAPASQQGSSNGPQPQLAPAQLTPAQLALVQLGPYVVISPLGPTESGELVLAQDPRLNRQVWVHVVPYGTPPAPSSLCNATRPGALHWLSGQRFALGGWDAYEAPDGAPLTSLLELQPWKIARHWLLDLALELQARLDLGLRDPLDLGRVWITRDGRAKLLDFHAPAARVDTKTPDHLNNLSAQRFLYAVANQSIGTSPTPPLPLSASSFLRSLSVTEFDTLADAIKALTKLQTQPDRVTERSREITLVVDAFVTLVGALVLGRILANPVVSKSIYETAKHLAVSYRDVGELACALLGIAAAVAFRSGFWLRAFRIAIVTRDGAEASRLRAVARALVVWSWVPAQVIAITHGWSAVVYCLFALKLVFLCWAAAAPERGLQDRIAGTYLVPR